MSSNFLAIEIQKVQHEILMESVRKLPPVERRKLTTSDQRAFLKMLQCKYGWIGRYIDYRQLIEFGLRPKDPLGGCWGEADCIRQEYRLCGDLYFAQLQLIISGWDFIKAKALQEKIDFPFAHPREMFAATMQENATQHFEPALMNGVGNGQRLKEVREEWHREARILRSYDPKEYASHLEKLQKGGWDGYWLYAIWDKRDSRDFEYPKQVWRQYLNAHKQYTAAIKKRGADAFGNRNVTIQWNAGRAVMSDLGCPVQWDYVDPVLNIA